MIVRLLLAVLIATGSTAAAEAGGSGARAYPASLPPSPKLKSAPIPRPLGGVPLRGSSGLRLLVSNAPPYLLDLDSGRITPVAGLKLRGTSALMWVQAVGKDAVIWLARQGVGEIYALSHGSNVARRIATGSDVAPAADGRAVWVKTFRDKRHCTLSELGLDARQRRPARSLPCSTGLFAVGSQPILRRGNANVDPLTGQTLLRGTIPWAIAGRRALTTTGSHGPLALQDLASGKRRPLPWPSKIGGPTSQGGTDQAVVNERPEHLIALDFADPAYELSGTQVTDVWLLDPTKGRFQHLPDMPAAVALKFTSMAWASDGRLVILAQTQSSNLVAVWRPGERRLAVRHVRLPVRSGGSDPFVVW